MAKFLLGAAATTLAATAIFATPAFASSAECQTAGGSIWPVDGKEYCLIQVRDEAYRFDARYDGQGYGMNECKFEELHKGAFCKVPMESWSEARSALSSPAASAPTIDSRVVLTQEEAAATVSQEQIDAALAKAKAESGEEMISGAVETAVETAVDSAVEDSGI